MINIALLQPEMPGNVGSVIRTCSCFGYKLYLVGPVGFPIHTQIFKRYAASHLIEPIYFNSNTEFFTNTKEYQKIGTSAHAETSYSLFQFTSNMIVLFGSESKGLQNIANELKVNIKIPMEKKGKCLNLAVSVGIIAAHYFSQNL